MYCCRIPEPKILPEAITWNLNRMNTFYTQHRYDQWKEVRDSDIFMLDHTEDAPIDKKFGTVGAVALDQLGNMAAATSTGGMTNKNFNRIGDTPDNWRRNLRE